MIGSLLDTRQVYPGLVLYELDGFCSFYMMQLRYTDDTFDYEYIPARVIPLPSDRSPWQLLRDYGHAGIVCP